MNKKKEKKCAICEKSKPKTEFSMSSRHLHRLEYCKDALKKIKDGQKITIDGSSGKIILEY